MSPIRKSPIRAAAVAACLLLVIGASAAVAGASPSGSPVARGTVVYEADLGVSQTDSPDPVNASNNILYAMEVVNAGPETATSVYLQGFIDDDAFIKSIDVVFEDDFERRGGPSCGTEGSSYWCNLGSLSENDSIEVELVVGTDNGTIPDTFNDVQVQANEPDGDSKEALPNESFESTTVEPRSSESDTGYIEPDGGSLTTDPGTGATATDTTVLTMTFPEGPGGTASLNEEECTVADEELFPCVGEIGNFQPPDGYDRIVAELIYDRTIIPKRAPTPPNPGHRVWQVHMEKNDVIQLLPRCKDTTPKQLVPCVLSTRRLESLDPEVNRDLRVRVLINSDPRLGTR